MNVIWYSAEIDFGYVSSRTLRVRVEVCVVMAYGPTEVDVMLKWRCSVD